MKKLKRWHKNLSYQKKIALNLLLVALTGFVLWWRAGYPLPTAEMEFRRLERQHMVPESEILLLSEREDDTFQVPGGPEIVIEDQWAVGVTKTQVYAADLSRRSERMIIQDKTEGVTLIPFGDAPGLWNTNAYWVTEGPIPIEEGGGYRYTHHNFAPIAAVGLPEEAASGVLWVSAPGQTLEEVDDTGDVGETGNREQPLVGGGWDMGNGLWLFHVMETDRVIRELGEFYRLRLFDRGGKLILEQEGQFSSLWW